MSVALTLEREEKYRRKDGDFAFPTIIFVEKVIVNIVNTTACLNEFHSLQLFKEKVKMNTY